MVSANCFAKSPENRAQDGFALDSMASDELED
jgi:hypothetical protein